MSNTKSKIDQWTLNGLATPIQDKKIPSHKFKEENEKENRYCMDFRPNLAYLQAKFKVGLILSCCPYNINKIKTKQNKKQSKTKQNKTNKTKQNKNKNKTSKKTITKQPKKTKRIPQFR